MYILGPLLRRKGYIHFLLEIQGEPAHDKFKKAKISSCCERLASS